MIDRKSWEKALAATQSAAADWVARLPGSLEQLEEGRLRFLGRKGELTELLKSLKDLSLDDKRELGPKAQSVKQQVEDFVVSVRARLESAADEAAASSRAIDLTLPGLKPPRGRLHPLTQTMGEMARILTGMGFSWAEGPLVEDDRHNFTALNIPEHHSARDMHDTFYLDGLPLLLRTHTSPVQIRAMETSGAPLRVIAPGRVFRHEAVDATHSAVFHQVEGLAIGEGIGFADLKGTLEVFFKELTGGAIRLRPSYFPFTEPSAEVDVQCFKCNGSGCALCKKSGWIELAGAGVVHPNVLKAAGLDCERWSGFAFGAGVERVAMLRLGVVDLRDFYTNDLRFLRQFDETLV